MVIQEMTRVITKACSFELVRGRVGQAIDTLRINDGELLSIGVNERSISHRLALYLQQEFPCWNVDCEYNRKMGDKKKLHYIYQKFEQDTIKADDSVAKTVYPDIIVHRRQREDNLLVIEIKKSNHNTAIDEEKLKAFTGEEYRYCFGLLLVVDSKSEPLLTWYQNGERVESERSSLHIDQAALNKRLLNLRRRGQANGGLPRLQR